MNLGISSAPEPFLALRVNKKVHIDIYLFFIGKHLIKLNFLAIRFI